MSLMVYDSSAVICCQANSRLLLQVTLTAHNEDIVHNVVAPLLQTPIVKNMLNIIKCVHVYVYICADAALIGQSSRELIGTQLFEQGTSTTQLCLDSSGSRDNQVCESDTHGTIRLINSSVVRLVEPYIASITITDDECKLVGSYNALTRIFTIYSNTYPSM